MGLDQYATVILATPENEPAKVPADLYPKINHTIYGLKLFDPNQGPDHLQLADYPHSNYEHQTFRIYNFENTDYKLPIFQLDYQHDNYLARKNYELKDFIFDQLKPKLKQADLDIIKKNNYLRNIQDYTIDDYFDITDYIPQINQEIENKKIYSNLEINLISLLSYQKTCQAILDELDTNLTAHVCYQQDY